MANFSIDFLFTITPLGIYGEDIHHMLLHKDYKIVDFRFPLPGEKYLAVSFVILTATIDDVFCHPFLIVKRKAVQLYEFMGQITADNIHPGELDRDCYVARRGEMVKISHFCSDSVALPTTMISEHYFRLIPESEVKRIEE